MNNKWPWTAICKIYGTNFLDHIPDPKCPKYSLCLAQKGQICPSTGQQRTSYY